MNYFKKTILSLISLILLFNISVSSSSIIFGTRSIYNYDTRTIEQEHKTTISANYETSDLSLNVKYHNTGSMLNWQDIHLRGARVNVEFDKAPWGYDRTSLGIGYSVSSGGHFVDDDSTNYANVINVLSPKTSLLDLTYEVFSLEDDKFIPGFGLDFNCLKLRNYDNRRFDFNHLGFSTGGLIAKYDVYKLGVYGGMRIRLVNSDSFALNATGQLGAGLYLALADWIYRQDFKHPVSFYDIALSFRVAGGLEMGIRLGDDVILFSEAQIFYETSPGLGRSRQFLSDGDVGDQRIRFNLLRTSFSLGVKVEF